MDITFGDLFKIVAVIVILVGAIGLLPWHDDENNDDMSSLG